MVEKLNSEDPVDESSETCDSLFSGGVVPLLTVHMILLSQLDKKLFFF